MSLNPMIEALNLASGTTVQSTSQDQQQNQIAQAIATAKSLTAGGISPVDALYSLAQQNPAYKGVADLVRQNGGNMQAAAAQMIQQRAGGGDISNLMALIQSALNK